MRKSVAKKYLYSNIGKRTITINGVTMIIDFHVHINKSEKLDYFHTFKSYKDLMDKNGVEKAQVMPNPSSLVGVIENNEEFIKSLLMSEEPERFYPFALFDSREKEKMFAQLERIKKHLSGLKYHGSISEMAISHPSLVDYFHFAEKHKLPVLVHCGRHHKSHISHLIDVAIKFPKVNFIAAHMGGNATDLVEEAVKLLKKKDLPNIYLDTSACELPRLIEMGVKYLGAKKILFGSDEPYKDIRIAKFSIELTEITEEDKRRILYENARELMENNR
jgi:predicted TIM-barrel fold metal-dependent hydrolase